MSVEHEVERFVRTDAAIATAYVLGKLAGNNSSISLEEISRIDMSFVEPFRDEDL